jgi:RNA polymerase-interacting CarD/CdnL/TRCF family regulator
VTAIEEREFGDGKQSFYVLELELDRGVKLMLPVGKVQQAGVRPLVTAQKARDLLKAVKDEVAPTEVKSDPASRKLRATGYAEALRSGSADRYTEILRELLSRSRASKLSAGEQQSLSLALAMFIGEMSAALGLPPDDVKASLHFTAEATTQ